MSNAEHQTGKQSIESYRDALHSAEVRYQELWRYL
jgi:hypothetical protein